jgi:PAS domain S-box-containing protein
MTMPQDKFPHSPQTEEANKAAAQPRSDDQRGNFTPERTIEKTNMVLSLAMQASRMGAWEREVATGAVWWSEELEEIFGLAAGTFGGTERHFYELMHADDRDASWSQVEAAVAEKRGFQFEFRFHHADGSIRWMEARGKAVYDRVGAPDHLYGVGIDITERKAAEARAGFLAELDRSVRALNDPAEVMQVTARQLAEFVGADRCAYAEVANENLFVITGDWVRDVPSIVGRWPVAAFGPECERLMLANEPYVVNDVDQDPRIGPDDTPAYRATSIASVICVPLHKEGRFTAAMAVHQARPRTWKAAEVDLVREVANRCWESLERARATRSLRESDERFRLALSNGAVTVYQQDRDLRYEWVYPEAPYSPDVIGRTDEEMTPGPAGEARTRIKLRAMETGQTLREEVSAVVKGEEKWYDLLAEPRRDALGNVTGVGGTALDITDRRRAEREARSTADRLNLALAAAELGDWSWDANTDLVTFSRRAAEIFGIAFGASITWTDIQGMLYERDREIAAEKVRQAVDSGERYETEYRVMRPDGTTVWVAAFGSSVYDEQGEPVGMFGVVQDITSRKRLQEDLSTSEARFRALMEQSPLSIQLFEPGGRHIQVNRAWEELWGTSMDKIPEYNVLEDPQLEERGIAETIRKVFQGEARQLPLIRYDPNETIPGGSENSDPVRWVSAIAFPLKDQDGKVQEVALIHQDVTETKRAEAILQRYRLLSEHARDVIWLLRPDGRLIEVNRAAEECYGYTREELLRMNISDLRAAGTLSALSAQLAAAGSGGTQFETVHVRKDGKEFPVEVNANSAEFGGERLIMGIVRDISERKLAEETLKRAHEELESRVKERTRELADSNAELVRQMEERARAEEERLMLLRRLFTIQEDERGRIARDIHDQLGQRVTALRLRTASIRELCADDAALTERIDLLQQVAEQLDSEVSFVSWELRPSILDDLNFADALQNYVAEWSRHSAGVTENSIGRESEINLYRIAQEALNNIAKHAGASHINILLEHRGGTLSLIIEDDGVGMSAPETGASHDLRHGFGLVGMRERALLIGGTLHIESEPGKGTSVFVRVPLHGASG